MRNLILILVLVIFGCPGELLGADDSGCGKGGDLKLNPPTLLEPEDGTSTNNSFLLLKWSSC